MKCWGSLELRRFRAEWNIGHFLAVREFSWTSAQPNLYGLTYSKAGGQCPPYRERISAKRRSGDLMIGDSANLVPRDPIC